MPHIDSLKSITFVFLQLFCLGLIAVTGPLIASNTFFIIIQFLGFILGIWAVLAMKVGNFHILPDPFSWSRLVTSGPYRLIRHPMYLALLMVTLPLVISTFTVFRLALYLVLLVTLLLKLNFEENLLRRQLEGYDQYTQQSFRLIPFIY